MGGSTPRAKKLKNGKSNEERRIMYLSIPSTYAHDGEPKYYFLFNYISLDEAKEWWYMIWGNYVIFVTKVSYTQYQRGTYNDFLKNMSMQM